MRKIDKEGIDKAKTEKRELEKSRKKLVAKMEKEQTVFAEGIGNK